MNRTYVSMLVLMAMCVCIVASLGYAQNASVNVVPASVTVGINGELVVNVTAGDIPAPGLWSYQLDLRFDPAILEGVSAEIPSDHMLKPSLKAGNIFIVDPGTIDQTTGVVSFALTLLADEPGKTGTGVLCTATFRGKAEGTSSLTFENVILVDPNSAEFPGGSFALNNGTVTVQGAGPAVAGDLNGDGKVNIQDVAVAATAFGSTPGHPRWNPIADINKDNVVDMIDFVQIARNFRV